jgi:histone-lysine N-methyltransferase SETD3
MLNHYRPQETKWTFDDDKQAFTITSLQTISRGAQVYDSYGQKCNHRFLLNYGFAVEDNREVDGFCPNEVPIELSIPPSDPLFDAKFEFWTHRESTASNASSIVHHLASAMAHPSLHLPSSAPPPPSASSSSTPPLPTIKRVRVCVSNNENTRILFSMLRVIVADEAQLRAITTAPGTHTAFVSGTALSRHVLGLTSSSVGGTSINSSSSAGGAALYRTCRDVRCPISFSNERAAMRHLQEVTAQALQGYPTSYEQDVQDLEDEAAFPRFSNIRHAKIQVRGEKEVLLHFSVWARTALKVMDVIEQELNGHVVNEHGNTMSSFEEIIRTLEDDDEKRTHVTIVRYCADVLDALRREEKKRRRRQLLHVGVAAAAAAGANNAASRYV